jgi:hypothetical protein
MVKVVDHISSTLATALAGSDGTQRAVDLDWDARAYVCHVVDNLRIWAERLASATNGSPQPIGTYDAELLAAGRNYRLPLTGALWSLADAIATWDRAVARARRGNLTLLHPQRGTLGLIDVASANAHDAYHHVWDVRRCVGR